MGFELLTRAPVASGIRYLIEGFQRGQCGQRDNFHQYATLPLDFACVLDKVVSVEDGRDTHKIRHSSILQFVMGKSPQRLGETTAVE